MSNAYSEDDLSRAIEGLRQRMWHDAHPIKTITKEAIRQTMEVEMLQEAIVELADARVRLAHKVQALLPLTVDSPSYSDPQWFAHLKRKEVV